MTYVGGFDEKMSRGIDTYFYRTCIVEFGYDVHFTPEVTTAVHEYGDGRITPVKTHRALKNIVSNQIYILWKFKIGFIRYPFSASKRL
jgi:hypothetical protein